MNIQSMIFMVGMFGASMSLECSTLNAAENVPVRQKQKMTIDEFQNLAIADDPHFLKLFGRLKPEQQKVVATTSVPVDDGSTTTLLHIASQHGNQNVVSQLIAAGANVTAENGKNHTPLAYAAARGHANVVKMLHDSTDSGNIVPKHYRDALAQTAVQGRLNVAQVLTQNYAYDPADLKKAANVASKNNNHEVAQYLNSLISGNNVRSGALPDVVKRPALLKDSHSLFNNHIPSVEDWLREPAPTRALLPEENRQLPGRSSVVGRSSIYREQDRPEQQQMATPKNIPSRLQSLSTNVDRKERYRVVTPEEQPVDQMPAMRHRALPSMNSRLDRPADSLPRSVFFDEY